MIENKQISVGIWGTGSYLPDGIISNFDLEKNLETNDQWITSRTGIKERRIISVDMSTSDMGVMAANKAIEDAGLLPKDIDLIIVATTTPDKICPSTACIIQDKIAAVNAAAIDINAACTGFIYGIALGSQLIATGQYKHILLIGSEALSRFLNPTDRNTRIIFGDGAGACVLGPVEDGKGLLAFDLGSDGAGQKLIQIEAGGSRIPASIETIKNKQHYISMAGNEVFKFAVKILNKTSLRVLDKAGMTIEQIDYLIPHQANSRIIQSALKRLQLPEEKVYINLDRYGNMSGASIPVALDEACREGKIKEDDLVLLVGFGAGLTWGSCLIRW